MRLPWNGWVAAGWSGVRRLLGVVRTDRGLRAATLGLLAIDLLWIVYFGISRSLYELEISSRLYEYEALLLTTERGLPEWFNYAQTLLVVFLLARLARSTRQLIYVALGVIFAIVVLDDALGIHESGGAYFVRVLEIRPVLGLRAHDVGEVITWALLGLATVPLSLAGLARALPRHRENGLALLLAFGALLYCAVFVDQLYSNFHDLFTVAGMLIDLVEDGGELLAISFACALALGAEREAALPGRSAAA